MTLRLVSLTLHRVNQLQQADAEYFKNFFLTCLTDFFPKNGQQISSMMDTDLRRLWELILFQLIFATSLLQLLLCSSETLTSLCGRIFLMCSLGLSSTVRFFHFLSVRGIPYRGAQVYGWWT